MIETGVLFDDIHSFYDLNLILSGCEISPALPKTNYVDIPGADGSIDLTEVHGEVKFSDRNCKFTFTMNPMGDLSETAWTEKKTEISNILAGRVFKITLDKDSDYYYFGRCSVDEFRSDKRLRQIVVSAKVKPYKLKHIETVLKYQLSKTAQTIVIQNSRKSVIPLIECSDNNTVIVFGTTTFNLNAGIHQTPDIMLVMGDNLLTVTGTGTIIFRFQEGDL